MKEVDADELDGHGHFSTDDIACTICDGSVEDHFVVGVDVGHEYENGT